LDGLRRAPKRRSATFAPAVGIAVVLSAEPLGSVYEFISSSGRQPHTISNPPE
jgi:hypothetical protein